MLRAEALVKAVNFGVLRVVRLFHGVEVIQNAVELVKAVDSRQIFVAVAEMVLPDLRPGVAMGLEQFGNRRIGILEPLLGGGHTHLQYSCAERSLAGNERSPARPCTIVGRNSQ